MERMIRLKPILEELFEGRIFPVETIVSRDPEYRPLNRKISAAMENWKKKLSPEDFEALEDLLDKRSESESMHASAAFTYGFKLGALIFLEVLDNKGEV